MNCISVELFFENKKPPPHPKKRHSEERGAAGTGQVSASPRKHCLTRVPTAHARTHTRVCLGSWCKTYFLLGAAVQNKFESHFLGNIKLTVPETQKPFTCLDRSALFKIMVASTHQHLQEGSAGRVGGSLLGVPWPSGLFPLGAHHTALHACFRDGIPRTQAILGPALPVPLWGHCRAQGGGWGARINGDHCWGLAPHHPCYINSYF